MNSNFKKERGASIVEYLLLLMLIVLIAIAAMQTFGYSLSDTFSAVSSSVDDATNPQ